MSIQPGTGLPWNAWGNRIGQGAVRVIGAKLIAKVIPQAFAVPIAAQDTAYIVRAANCFPELVEALEALTLFHESGGHEGDADEAIALARAALAKANEGEGR